ncbi:MAG: DUF4258 domain-containing protein [Sulfurimonas sp.]|nr:DUF4258 domain-containing protein [Sulfurimonas sp.]
MILTKIRDAINKLDISWQKHSLQRMFERDITRQEVKTAILYGIIIEDYTDDYPFPSVLIAYINDEKSLHVVVSYDDDSSKCYIITAYVPDRKYFKDDLITRREDEETKR